MTDTVNVPREWLERLAAWINREVPVPTRSATRWAMDINDLLAAAPKAEPAKIDSSSGSVYDRLLTFIHDRDDALRGDDRTDPHEVDESVLEIMRIAGASPEAPKVEKRPVGWDSKYRPLEGGEIILASDEVQHDDGSWHPSASVGQEAPDPSYTSHRVYRRLKHTAPASDELLGALGKLVTDWHGDKLSTVGVMNSIDALIAKHKGPQS